MKKILLFLMLMLQMAVWNVVDAQGLTLSNVQNSGCLRENQRRANGEGQTRTIVLLKEGSILSVQLLNYEANCGTEGFDVTPSMSGGSDGTPCSLTIQVVPVGEEDMDCICPYNVSFTVYGLETNSFYFSCWWYEGQVSLTEGEPLTLEDISESINIDGVHYTLHKAMHTAKLANGKAKEGELIIPKEIYHEDVLYPVTRIEAYAFNGNSALTSVTIPNSVSSIGIAAFYRCSNLKDVYCYCEDKLPSTEGYTFTDTPVATATLHVPAGSIEKYKAVSPWNEFGNIVAIEKIAKEYFPEGTKWTEIRLDTLKYDSWYSKVGDEWMPNFETIEYRVEGEYTDQIREYNCVYTNGPEWADSLIFLLFESGHNVGVTVISYDYVMYPGETYQFDWSVGKGLYYQDIEESNSTGIVPYYFFYGVVDEIKEGYFGGVRPLKYVDLDGKAATLEFGYCIDTRGGRIIQGIGITEWNDGECLFGPPNPYFAMTGSYNDRHYRSMLVHFERDGEVLYDVWPEKPVAIEPVTFTAGQMATIVLPTEPDASKGKYYRLDRVEDRQIIFEQELQPQAHIPYIIVPSEDFSIDPSDLHLEGLSNDTVSIDGISFIGTYSRKELNEQEGFYIDIIDTTPDCTPLLGEGLGERLFVGALRAWLQVNWDDPIDHGGAKSPEEKKLIVLKDNPDGISQLVNCKLSNGKCYDLSGRSLPGRPRSGLYIEGNRKTVR